jgi:ubiquinone/menaquinone biosynthesis C-methylase UbiE
MEKNTYKVADHLTKEDHAKLGADYTPREIAIRMAKKLEWKQGMTILDPTVGKGNLLLACKETYPELTNDLLYGSDVDVEAIQYCRKIFPGGHFIVANAIEDDLSDEDLWKQREFANTAVPIKKTFASKFGRL